MTRENESDVRVCRVRQPVSIVKKLRKSERYLKARLMQTFRYDPNYPCIRVHRFKNRSTWTIIDRGWWPLKIDAWERRRSRIERENARIAGSIKRVATFIAATEVLKVLAEHPVDQSITREEIFNKVIKAGQEFLQRIGQSAEKGGQSEQ